ncbi:hypothetical protein [Halothiobacillus sp. DCM-1]|uniref:hypothetical protein n=1 Tax=Halothiobacillus sp. DCM-1 TaxID=3112558 RepID=UPI0032504ED7
MHTSIRAAILIRYRATVVSFFGVLMLFATLATLPDARADGRFSLYLGMPGVMVGPGYPPPPPMYQPPRYAPPEVYGRGDWVPGRWVWARHAGWIWQPGYWQAPRHRHHHRHWDDDDHDRRHWDRD